MNYRKFWAAAYSLYSNGGSALELFNKINRIIKDICYKRLINKDVVRGGFSIDDLLQECSIKLYALMVKLTLDRDSNNESDVNELNFEAYISSVVRNKLIDLCRKMKSVETLDLKFKRETRVSHTESVVEFRVVYAQLRKDCDSLVVNGGIILDTLFNTGAHGVLTRLAAIGITDSNEKYMYKRIRKVKNLVKEYAYGKEFSDKVKSKRSKGSSS